MGERHYPQYKKIDGAVLTSESENNLECAVTFQTDSILQRFMLRFERLALDCHDHLVIFDGAHAIGNQKVLIQSCSWFWITLDGIVHNTHISGCNVLVCEILLNVPVV